MTRRSALLLLMLLTPAVLAQSLYKSRGPDGEWVYSDQPPADAAIVEQRELGGQQFDATVMLRKEAVDNGLRVVAVNEFHCPVEIRGEVRAQANVGVVTRPAESIVLAALGEGELLHVMPAAGDTKPKFKVQYQYFLGDPEAQHDGRAIYRAPYARGSKYRVTQAFPSAITHSTPGSRHAIDFAMPEGTPVLAARAGTVVQIAYDSYSGGLSRGDVAKANLVRILHPDGTLAVYAHLQWQSIRVRPGDEVVQGERIANSGNTGFSSGPHLHFAVQRNSGMDFESVPVAFMGLDGTSVGAANDSELASY